jgi:exosortase/archaeosortase family protein
MPAMLVVSYMSAVFVNGLRITLSVYASHYIKPAIPVFAESALHMWCGLLLFIPVVVGIYIYFERRYSPDESKYY